MDNRSIPHQDTGEEATEAKVLTAEFRFDQNDASQNMEAIDAKLQRVNSELEQFANKADRTDYAVALACGILSGVLDSLFVGEFSLEKAQNWAEGKIHDFYLKTARMHNYKGKKAGTEELFKFMDDKKGKPAAAVKFGKASDLSWDPSLRGLFFCILTQFTGKRYFEKEDGVHGEEIKNKKLLGEDKGQKLFFGIMLWFFHLVHHIADSNKKGTEKPDMPGVPKQICSLASLLAMIPFFKDSSPEQLTIRSTDLVSACFRKYNLAPVIGFMKEAGKQALPVLLNEVCVRGFYAMRRLTKMLTEKKIADVSELDHLDWAEVFPVTNRTLSRMLMVAHITFVTVDTADAAFRALVESGGEWVLFSTRFAARYNFIGAGRAAIEIFAEISNEKREAQLLHEKTLLMEEKAEMMYQRLQAYKEQLEEKLSDYLAEDMEAFLEGFDDINKGFLEGSSDLVIRGNITIQKALGRKAQFTNQKEFDDLMDSDIALEL